MCYLITLTNYMKVTYHNNTTVIFVYQWPLQVNLWLCHEQVGHQRLVYFDQAIHDCCAVPITTFNKGTISIVVFNSTTSLIES